MQDATEKRRQKKSGRWTNRLMNVALVVLGLVVLVLLYALAMRFLTPRIDPTRENNPGQLVGRILQVEVRNGCGVAGVAGTMTKYLRRHGFDVVEVGNYAAFDEPRSLVIDRVGDLEAAKKIAQAIGIEDAYIRQEVRPELYLDATVVIGKDYATLRPFQGK